MSVGGNWWWQGGLLMMVEATANTWQDAENNVVTSSWSDVEFDAGSTWVDVEVL